MHPINFTLTNVVLGTEGWQIKIIYFELLPKKYLFKEEKLKPKSFFKSFYIRYDFFCQLNCRISYL
jgi:hypothetical protein